MKTILILLLATQASACGIIADGGLHHQLPALLAWLPFLGLAWRCLFHKS